MQMGFQERILGKGWSAIMLLDSIVKMDLFISAKETKKCLSVKILNFHVADFKVKKIGFHGWIGFRRG